MSKTQNVILAIFILILLAIPYIAYQSLVAIPKEKLEAERELAANAIIAKQAAEEKRREQYDQCISTAWQTYSSNWDQTCEVSKLEKDCTLPAYLSTGLDDRHEQAKDRCVALYK